MKRSLVTLAMLGVAYFVPNSASAQDETAARQALQEFTLTLTGDSLIMAPVTVHENQPQFMGLLKVIREGDARYTNLEEIYPGPTAYAGAGSAMWTDPEMFKQLQWMGFNLYSAANNHTMDYGVQGVLDTIDVLHKENAVYSGIGKTLDEARRPGYLMTPHGRVAIVHTTSSLPGYETALDPRGDMSGRPGPSILRYQTTYQVDAATFDMLHKVRQQLSSTPNPNDGLTGTGAQQKLTFPVNASGLSGFTPPVFQVGDKPAVFTKANPDDLAALVHEVKDARSFADFVIVSIHAHEGALGPGAKATEQPADFLVEFAHAAIDAGADVFIGTGPHVLKPIEIYKGKVIFYSIGNLFFQHQLQSYPLAYYNQFHLGSDALPADVIQAEDKANPQDDALLYQGALAKVVFHNGNPDVITLTPIALTSKFPRGDGGYPVLADAKMGAQILNRLEKISEPYGTKINIENGVGIIKVSDSHPIPSQSAAQPRGN